MEVSLIGRALLGLAVLGVILWVVWAIQRSHVIQHERIKLKKASRIVLKGLFEQIEAISPASRRVKFSLPIARTYGWVPWHPCRRIRIVLHLENREDEGQIRLIVSQFVKGSFIASQRWLQSQSYEVHIQVVSPPPRRIHGGATRS